MTTPISPWSREETRRLYRVAAVQDQLIAKVQSNHPGLTSMQITDIVARERNFTEAAIAQGIENAYRNLDDEAVIMLASLEAENTPYTPPPPPVKAPSNHKPHA